MDSVLRFSNLEYASIISTGVNAEGKAIKSPLDGFTLVPGSNPPKFIMVQHTTVKIEDLESKWLFDHTTAKGKQNRGGNDGDVVKAGQYANEILQKHPDAEFVLILTTNRSLSLNKHNRQDPLVLKTYEKCLECGIKCEIWEQSRIAHFLDNTPEGHWLRWKYLGIDAELLSEKLLEEICKINLERYKKSYYLDDNDLFQRDTEISVSGGINKQNYGLHLLFGESGFGKSTIAYHLLKKHLDSGGFGLWIPVENILDGLPLENIIANTLKQIYSQIRIDHDTGIWKFSTQKQFLIIIDDINRSLDPTKILRRIISFLPQIPTEDGKPKVKIPFSIILPVWPKYWTPISQEFRNHPFIHETQINKFTLEESESLIINAFQKQGTEITRLKANQIANTLGCDPLLIGLFTSTLRKDDIQTSLISHNVIRDFIHQNIEVLSQKSPVNYLVFEYIEVISKICNEMLIQKSFFPTFSQIEGWLCEKAKYIEIFRELITNRILCSIEHEKLVFRHDRIQFFLLTQAMINILDSDPRIRSNIISEPFYAELIGQSILHKEQSNSQLDEIQQKNILSFFEALKIFGDPVTDYYNKIVERIISWIKEEKRLGYPKPSVIDAINWIIVDIDSNAIISITDYLPQTYPVHLSRIRNGSVDSGVKFCSTYDDFEPSSTNYLRDRIFEHAKEMHPIQIQKELREILQSDTISDKQRFGALIFLGFLKLPSFEKDIHTCWRNTQDKKLTLTAALWAGIECCDDTLDDTLNPMMEYWASLSSDIDPSSGLSDIIKIADYLRFSIKRRMTNCVVKYLISQCERHQTLKWSMIVLLREVNDPDAIEFVVTTLSIDYPGSFFGLTMTDCWNPKIFSYGRLLSSQSLVRLEMLWKDEKNHQDIRKNAFKLWKTGANHADTDLLKTVLPNTPIFKESVILRAELEDWSVLPDYLSIISEDAHPLYVAHHLWCDDIKRVVERYLESFKENISSDFKGGTMNEHYILTNLIMTIPKEEAEILLDTYWSHLKYSPLFIQSALYIGTQRTLELAKIAVLECPQDIDIFRHISLHFSINDMGRLRTLSLKRLNDLKPYLSRFNEDEIRSLYLECKRSGFMGWADENLVLYLSDEDKKRELLSDNDLLEYLRQPDLKPHLSFHISYAIEENRWGKDTRERVLRAGQRLLTDDPSQTSLEIVSIILKTCGNRRDLAILDDFGNVGDTNKIAQIIQDTQFQVFYRTLE